MSVVSGWAGWIPFGLPVRVGGGVELAPLPAVMEQFPDEGGARRMSSYDGKLLAAWCPAWLELGATTGLSYRVLTDPTASPPPPAWIPTVGVLLAGRMSFFRVAVSGDYDIAGHDLYYPETTPAGRLPRYSLGVTASVWTGDGSLSKRGSTAGAPAVR